MNETKIKISTATFILGGLCSLIAVLMAALIYTAYLHIDLTERHEKIVNKSIKLSGEVQSWAGQMQTMKIFCKYDENIYEWCDGIMGSIDRINNGLIRSGAIKEETKE